MAIQAVHDDLKATIGLRAIHEIYASTDRVKCIYSCTSNKGTSLVLKITAVFTEVRRWRRNRGELLIAIEGNNIPNINRIKYRAFFDERGTRIRNATEYCYVAELSDYILGETLFRYVQNHGPLGVDDMIDFGIQIADITLQLHQRRILLRDLKPGNFLIDFGKKLYSIDHELVRKMDLEEPLSPVGTAIAPEVYPVKPDINSLDRIENPDINFLDPIEKPDINSLVRNENLDINFLDRIDSFSFGAILYYLLTKRQITRELLISFREGEIDAIPFNNKERYDTVFVEMIEQLLKRNPKERMSMDQAYNKLVQYKKERELDRQKAIEWFNLIQNPNGVVESEPL